MPDAGVRRRGCDGRVRVTRWAAHRWRGRNTTRCPKVLREDYRQESEKKDSDREVSFGESNKVEIWLPKQGKYWERDGEN